MELIILFNILFALLCYKVAEDNNRDKILALLMGILFGIFAVVGYAIAGKKK